MAKSLQKSDGLSSPLCLLSLALKLDFLFFSIQKQQMERKLLLLLSLLLPPLYCVDAAASRCVGLAGEESRRQDKEIKVILTTFFSMVRNSHAGCARA